MKKHKKTPLVNLLIVLLAGVSSSVWAQESQSNTVYEDSTQVDQLPQYPGGEDVLRSDFIHAFEYPSKAREYKIEGDMILKFIVEIDGSLSRLEVAHGLAYGMDEAAVAAVKMLKRFVPAQKGGKPVRYLYTLPVTCHLE